MDKYYILNKILMNTNNDNRNISQIFKSSSPTLTFSTALFDLDGVVFDTEPLYSVFWREEGKRYHPEIENFENIIKGQTLVEIFNKYFSDVQDEHPHIIERLDAYEQNMKYDYVKGFEAFLKKLKQDNIHTAIVTSSNRQKMESVYLQHPEVPELFDKVFTSEYFTESKPSPDCYLKAADYFGVSPSSCVVFEDSINGLRSGRASGAFVVGVATTNARELIAPLSDMVIDDFLEENATE